MSNNINYEFITIIIDQENQLTIHFLKCCSNFPTKFHVEWSICQRKVLYTGIWQLEIFQLTVRTIARYTKLKVAAQFYALAMLLQIADFGMSKYLQDKAYYKTNSGKIPVKWTAPEVIRIRALNDNIQQYCIHCVGHSLSEIYHSE